MKLANENFSDEVKENNNKKIKKLKRSRIFNMVGIAAMSIFQMYLILGAASMLYDIAEVEIIKAIPRILMGSGFILGGQLFKENLKDLLEINKNELKKCIDKKEIMEENIEKNQDLIIENCESDLDEQKSISNKKRLDEYNSKQESIKKSVKYYRNGLITGGFLLGGCLGVGVECTLDVVNALSNNIESGHIIFESIVPGSAFIATGVIGGAMYGMHDKIKSLKMDKDSECIDEYEDKSKEEETIISIDKINVENEKEILIEEVNNQEEMDV